MFNMENESRQHPNKQTQKNPQQLLVKLSSAIWVGIRPLPKLQASLLILGIVSAAEMTLGSARTAFLETTLLFIPTGKEATVARDKAFLLSE